MRELVKQIELDNVLSRYVFTESLLYLINDWLILISRVSINAVSI